MANLKLIGTSTSVTADNFIGHATSASKLGSSTVGDFTQPIYLLSGFPTPISSVAIECGGTGATTAEMARANLGAAPIYIYSTEDIVAGETTLTTGVLYLVYE